MDVCSPGSSAGARPRMGALGDQLHGDEPVRAGPRRGPRDGRAPERRPAHPARARGPAGAGRHRRDPDQPTDRGRVPRWRSDLFGRSPDEVRIYPEGLEDALAIARRHGLVIDTVHVHAGYLYLTDALPQVDETMRPRRRRDAAAAGGRVPDRRGEHRRRARRALPARRSTARPGRPGRCPRDPPRTSRRGGRHRAGEFLAKECAVHLAEAVSVEDRDGTTFETDTGWNVINEHRVPDPVPSDPCVAPRMRNPSRT